MRYEIWDYMEENLKNFELGGVEIVEDDVEAVEIRMREHQQTLEQACDEVLQGIRDCLDEGLDEMIDLMLDDELAY